VVFIAKNPEPPAGGGARSGLGGEARFRIAPRRGNLAYHEAMSAWRPSRIDSFGQVPRFL